MLPERLTWIDDTNRSDHFFLEAHDRCYFFGEYFSGKGYSGGPTNQLIHNFKIKPSVAAANAARGVWKQRAVREIAAALKRALTPASIPQMTFVPIPTSKVRGHADYCDRLARTLRMAFPGPDADIRDLLVQTQSTEADHASSDRRSKEELYSIIAGDPQQLTVPVRNIVVLFDDVLTSGKHFKVCEQRLREVVPNQQIVGLFIARCVRPNPFADFVDLDAT